MRFFGRRAWPVPEDGSSVVAQSFTSGTVITRCHFPVWITSGRLLPVGTPGSVKWP